MSGDTDPHSAEAVPDDRPATYRQVFEVREFRFLFSAHLLSLIGDQLAKVALSVLVFDQTNSALLSALTFAVGYLPWLIGGPLLSVYADRFPRRRVMIGCDLIRMVLIVMLAIPGMPLWLLVGLLFAANLLTPPFEAARSATMPEVLEGDRYAVGIAVSNITAQLSQVLGFVAGGALVLLLSARGALVADAATFGISAVLLAVGVRRRALPEPDGPPGSLWADAMDGLRVLFGARRLRTLILMLWAASAAAYSPEGLAAAYADELGRGPVAVGLLLAVSPLGVIVGGVVVGRMIRPSRRERLLTPLALLAVIALTPAAFVGWFPGVLLLFFVSGFGISFIIPLNVMVVRAVPPAFRGRAFGVAATGLQAVQGIGIVLAGLVAEYLAPSTVVSLCGLVGTVLVTGLVLSARGAPTTLVAGQPARAGRAPAPATGRGRPAG